MGVKKFYLAVDPDFEGESPVVLSKSRLGLARAMCETIRKENDEYDKKDLWTEASLKYHERVKGETRFGYKGRIVFIVYLSE